MTEKFKYCVNCGAQIDYHEEFCPGCGVRQPHLPRMKTSYPVKKKSPGLAAILSVAITGLGQIYVGQITRGLAFLIFGIILGIATALAHGGQFIWIIGIIIWCASAYDAYNLAQKYNRYIEIYGEAPW